MGFMTRYGFVAADETKGPFVLGIYWGIIQVYIPLLHEGHVDV